MSIETREWTAALRLGRRRARAVLRLATEPRHGTHASDPEYRLRSGELLRQVRDRLTIIHEIEDLIFARAMRVDPALRAPLAHLQLRSGQLLRKERSLAQDLKAGQASLRVTPDRVGRHARQLLAELDEREAITTALVNTHAHALRKLRLPEPAADPWFDARHARGDELFDHYLGRVERIPGRGSAKYAILFSALAETFGLLKGQWHEAIDQQRRYGVHLKHALQDHGRSLISASARRKAPLILAAIRQEGRHALRQPLQVARLLGSDARELHSAAVDLQSLLQRIREQRVPLRSPSWQCGLFNLAARTSMKQALRTAKSFDELHAALRRVETGAAPDEFEFDAQRVRGRWQGQTAAGDRRVILYFCGGGFMIPPSKLHSRLTARLATITKARVFTSHYRLLPEHPFPAALDDALTAYRFVLSQGYEPQQIAVAGDSAGGCLGLSLLLRLRDLGIAMPSSAAVLSPLTDMTCSGRSRIRNRWHDPLTAARNPDLLAPRYLPAGVAPDDPIASPLFGDYRELPPILAQVGSTEILLDDVLRLAPRARAAAVDFRVQVWPGVPHCWQIFGFLPEARAAIDDLAAHFNEHWSAGRRRARLHRRYQNDSVG